MTVVGRMGIFQASQKIISDKLGIDPNSIEMSSDIESEGVDSLDKVEIIIEHESEFGISIPDQDIEKMKTVNDIVMYIHGRLDSQR